MKKIRNLEQKRRLKMKLLEKQPTKIKGLIEYTSEGTLLTLPRDRINDKEAIGLILYANDPNLLPPKEVARLLALSGRPSAGFGARLSELRNEGLVVKDGGAYRLTLAGKSWIENLVSKLKV